MKSVHLSSASKSSEFTVSRTHLPRYIPRLAAFMILVGLIASSFYVASSASSSKGSFMNKRTAPSASVPQVQSRLSAPRFSKATDSSSVLLHPPVPPMTPETIATFAADCTTPKATFTIGETVCAITDNVDLNFPEPGRWVDWILTGTSNTIVSGSRTTTRITTNPQSFTYIPTATGVYKVEITEDFDGQDNPQTPAVFTVVNEPAPVLATYASDCLTRKTSFYFNETTCIKVTGLSSDEFPLRRVQVSSPNGLVLERFDVTDNSVQFNYTFPNTDSEVVDGQTISHLGTWSVSLIDPDANLVAAVPVVVHKSNVFADRFADLNLSKVFLLDPGDPPPTAGTNIKFQLHVFNAGPDPATNPFLADVTLPNTTFVSFIRNSQVSSNRMPNTNFGLFMPDTNSWADSTISNASFARFFREPAFSAMAVRPGFLSFMGESPLEFICTSPSPGSPGTTNCSSSGELAPGETATFTAVYQVSNSVGNGAELSDNNSATVGSSTADQSPSSDGSAASVNTSTNPNPPPCAITCPDNITVGTTASGGATVYFGDAETSGPNCSGPVTSSPASGSFFPVGSTNVTTTVGSGPSCTFTVTVVDTPQPTISCPSDKSAAAPSGQSEVAVNVGTPSFTGNQATLSSSRSDQRDVSEPYPIGVTTITWTVTDHPYGSTASCTQKVTVTSADQPTISCPSNKTFNSTNGCTYTATAQEIGTPTTSGAASSSGEPCPLSNPCAVRSDNLPLTDPFPAGNTFITWTARNNVGSASCTQTITVVGNDTEAPTLHVPPSITTSTDQCSVLLDEEQFVATAEDNCSSSVNISRTGIPRIACPAPGDPNRTCESFVFPTGTTVITYTATDSAGNSSTGTQTVRVNENPNITPTISAPADLTLNTGPNAPSCDTFVGDATLGTATTSDNCPGVVVTRTGVPSGNIFPVGTTTITYRATDRVGNYAEDTQTVTVVDNTPPVVTPPANVTAYTGAGATSCGTVVSDATLGTASATDNCPGVGAVSRTGVPSGNNFPVGITTLTYSATDAHGNTGTAIQTVTVIDNTPPVISCPASITLEPTCPSGAIATYATPTATDNCAVQSVVRTAGGASGSVFPIGTTTVTHQATDIYGNTASCSFTVTVKTPTQTINDMETYINGLSSLTGTQKQGLISKLEAAKSALATGPPGTNVACNKLNDFMTQVQNYINNGSLTSAQGQPLLNSARNVRNTIGCTNNPCS
jgi:uncharacterized repeat protein (TIGR01451 family)